MSRLRMLLRIMLRSATVRRGRTLLTLLAIAVAAAVSTALLNLYVDMQAKLHREFRSYGANVLVSAKEGDSLPAGAITTVERELAGRGTAMDVAYAAVHTREGSPVVVAGVDMESARKLNTWWSVSGWPSAPGSALIGVRALAALSPNGQPLDLIFDGRVLRVAIAGTLQTGGAEDSRIYLSQADFAAWTGLRPSVVEIAVAGTPQEINGFIGKLEKLLPTAQIQPVRQIVEAEARVFDKTRSALLASVALIIITAFLCVLATLISSVLDRRKDFAVMKALGASQRTANLLFAGESASLGAAGALLGYIAGIALAALIGKINFHAGIEPRWSIFPAIVAGSVALTLLTAAIPITILNRIQPAVILKGE
jgi:putative ABC transport system permease protein